MIRAMRASGPAAVLLLAMLLSKALPAQRPDFDAAAKYSADHAGLAVLVYVEGKLVFEQYQNGHRQETPQHIFSGTKSFAPIVALIAQHEGLLQLDEKVCDTIAEWQGDKNRERITIRHLLNFTSGLTNNDSDLHSAKTRDKYAASVACEGKTAPGQRFQYGSNHLMVFGEVMRRKLAKAGTEAKPLPKDFVGYLQARVLDRIDCKFSSWLRDAEGNPALPYGAFLTAREWGKFGLLVLDGGKHGEKQIVPKEHFAECFVGSKANPEYGLNFWLIGARAHRHNERIPADTVTAAGMYDQKLYLMPSQKMLVVRFGRTGAKSKFNDLGFLDSLFGE